MPRLLFQNLRLKSYSLIFHNQLLHLSQPALAYLAACTRSCNTPFQCQFCMIIIFQVWVNSFWTNMDGNWWKWMMEGDMDGNWWRICIKSFEYNSKVFFPRCAVRPPALKKQQQICRRLTSQSTSLSTVLPSWLKRHPLITPFWPLDQRVFWNGSFQKRRLELNWVAPPDRQESDFVGLYRFVIAFTSSYTDRNPQNWVNSFFLGTTRAGQDPTLTSFV